jgi:hypothetical protein
VVALHNAVVTQIHAGQYGGFIHGEDQRIWVLVACVARVVHWTCVSHCSLGIRRDGC